MGRKKPPANSLESQENRMISLAMDLAEKQLENGTASAQVITHYLKLATTTARLEREKLVHENELLKAKTESIQSIQRTEELYRDAIEAMRSYGGSDDDE